MITTHTRKTTFISTRNSLTNGVAKIN